MTRAGGKIKALADNQTMIIDGVSDAIRIWIQRTEIYHPCLLAPIKRDRIERRILVAGRIAKSDDFTFAVHAVWRIPRLSTQIAQLVDVVEDIAGVRLRRKYDLNAPKGVNGRNSDNTLIKKFLNWEPDDPLRTGLEKTYAWIYDQYLAREKRKIAALCNSALPVVGKTKAASPLAS